MAADKLRSGRPPKPKEEKQSERTMVSMTKSERDRLDALARKEGMSLGSLIMRPWREP